MKVIYSDQPYDSLETNSIFLAGPTPRSNDVSSWRPEALDILKKMGFTGTVLVPEFSNGNHQINYNDQIEWEFQGLSQCGAIVFWVPSDSKDMPAITTRTEFGMFLALRPNDVFYGRPEGAWKTEYLDWWAFRVLDSVYHSLTGLLEGAVFRSEEKLKSNAKIENVFKKVKK